MTFENLSAHWRRFVESLFPGDRTRPDADAPVEKEERGLIFPKDLGEREVGVLDLMLPDGAHLQMESPGVLLLNFFGHHSHKMLFTIEFKLEQKPDFSGTSFSNLIKDFAGTAAARYRTLENSDMPMDQKIVAVVEDTAQAVRQRHLKSKAYSLVLRKVHTTHAHDWY